MKSWRVGEINSRQGGESLQVVIPTKDGISFRGLCIVNRIRSHRIQGLTHIKKTNI
jgi:hypothetical protein